MSNATIEIERSVPFEASAAVRAALGRIGRTEDARFSPDGRRLVLAGFGTQHLLILDVRTELGAERPHVALTGFVEIESASFQSPHGSLWADDDTLIVANRHGHIVVVAVPKETPAGSTVRVEPLRLIGADGKNLVTTPGSLWVTPVGLGLIELLVCNNYVNHVSRHLIDQRDGYAVLASEILITEGLLVPDGVARSPCGQWIAVSSHDDHVIQLYRDDDRLGPATEPHGTLTGLCYPHGLKFSGDGTRLLVADAGAPFVHIFRCDDGDWSGERASDDAIRVLSQEDFLRGHNNPREGGPKGIDMTADQSLLVTTCEEQPLMFFETIPSLREAVGPAVAMTNLNEAERARDIFVRYLGVARDSGQQETEALRRARLFEGEARAESERVLRSLRESRSWRVTAPLRGLGTLARKIAGRG